MIGKIIFPLLLLECVFMLPGAIICYADGNLEAMRAFFLTMVVAVVLAGIIYLFSKNAERKFYAREGLATTGIAWIVMSLVGCLPFYISKEIPQFIDALFEIVSGFTTTGSSILTDIESMSRGLLYWRSFSHWVGGMGVLVFLMAVVPLSGKNSGFTLHILRAESPGPSVGKLVPRMKQTAVILYYIYIGLTVLDFICLFLAGMPVFDAVCTAFGTAGTGGFGVRGDSLASYNPAIQNLTTVFMMLFGVNFSCYYLLLIRHFKEVFFDEELRLYLSIILFSIIAISLNIAHLYNSFGETLRHTAFQVGSIISTSGFATTDFDQWPSFSKAILLFLMMCGASAGSTGGGMKVARILMSMKVLRRNVHENLHPSEIRKIRFNGNTLDEKVLKNLNGYLIAYFTFVVISFLLISLDHFSLETNISAVMCTFNNIGPGFASVGPTLNFSQFSVLSKVVFIVDMLAGRLEIYPIMILAAKSNWARK